MYLLNLLRHFGQQHQVSAALAVENCLMIERVRELGVPFRTYSLSYRGVSKVSRQLAEWHRGRCFDVIHANGRRSQFFGSWLQRRTGLPMVGADLVATLSTGGPWREALKNLTAAWINRWLVIPRMQRLIVLCEFMRRQSLEQLRVPAEKVVTVYNGVDHRHFSPADAEPGLLPIEPERLVVVCSARFVPHKGHRVLIEAVDQLRQRLDLPFSVLLIGDGPEEAALRSEVAQRGLQDLFLWMEFPPDIRPYLARASLVVLPSFQEGVPTALLQGMAMARPVVGTDLQGIPEIVEHDWNGLTFPAGDAGRLAHHLQTLLSSPETRIRMGQRGRQRLLERFTLERMLDRIEQLYGQAIGLGRTR